MIRRFIQVTIDTNDHDKADEALTAFDEVTSIQQDVYDLELDISPAIGAKLNIKDEQDTRED